MSDADSITRKEAIAEVVRLRSEVAYLTFNRDHLAAANKSMHAELVALRAALNWLRHWRTKDHESIDCTIQHALGEAETCDVCHPHGSEALPANVGPSIPEVNERAETREQLLARLTECELALHHYSGGASEYFLRYTLGGRPVSPPPAPAPEKRVSKSRGECPHRRCLSRRACKERHTCLHFDEPSDLRSEGYAK